MSYRGVTVRLPIGAQGFTGTKNPSQAGPGHLTFVDGAELDGGIIRKEGGAQKINSVALGAPSVIVSGISWDPVSGVKHDVVFLSNGTVRQEPSGAGTFPVTMVSGLTNVREPPPYFVPAGGESIGSPRKLYLFSSPNQAHVALGQAGTMAPISGPAADWAGVSFPTFGILHQGRMFAGGNNSDPHRIYYSTLTNHSDFTGAGSGTLAIFPGESERLVGGISFRGALILFKYPFGIYIVNTSSLTASEWVVARMTRAVGTLSQHSIVQVENDVLYMDHVGNIHNLKATQEFGDINTSDLSKVATLEPFVRTEVNRIAIRRVQGAWYAAKKQAWFCLPRTGATDNDLRLIIGFEQQPTPQGEAPPRFFMSRRDVCVSLWMRPDTNFIPRPLVGDNVGFIWQLDDLSRNKAGAAYPVEFETANTDLAFLDDALATRMKAGQFLELASEPRGDWDLTVEVFWDDVLTDVLQYTMGGTGAVLGEFILDTDILGSDQISSNRKRLTGSGRRVKLVASNTGLDQDVSISDFHLSFNVMDERIRDAG